MSWVSIDFGTCNTAAAIEIDGAPHIVSYGNQQFFPTVACVLEDGTIEVCQNAEPLRQINPETFKQEFKLQIADTLDICEISYEDIVTEILSFVKGCAELENNGNPIDNVVLTIPAIYTEIDKRKAVMQKSAKRAGFRQIEFLSEPQAAAAHYAYISDQKTTGLSLIYDLGGGTFDPTLLEICAKTANLLGNESGVKCGGHYFDRALFNYISAQAQEDGKPLVRSEKLKDYAACNRIKEALSIKDSATQLFSNGVRYTINRIKFNELISPMIDKTLQTCDHLISTAGRRWTDVRQILLVGGSTAIPLISEMLAKHMVSHNASEVKIIRNIRGVKGDYNHRFATCLGGISGKILPPPPPPEKVAQLICGNEILQLKLGNNKFGRGQNMDFTFTDPHMSRHHFEIHVERNSNGRLTYTIYTRSSTQSTIINNLEALNLALAPIARTSTELFDGDTIFAGKTLFTLKKSHLNDR